MSIPSSRQSSRRSPRAAHQFVTRLAWGDAVGNQARYLRDLLRGWGYHSEIYAEQWDEQCRDLVRPVREYPRQANDDGALLIHHSFHSRELPLLARSPGRKALVYHNITPARFFEGFERRTAQASHAARDELLELSTLVECAYAYSGFSAEELVAAGFPNVSVAPFAVDWRVFDVPPDPVLRAELDDGCTNILFVGRIVPHKHVDDVLRVFTAYQRLLRPRSRLLIVGALQQQATYSNHLYGLRDALGPERVQFLGRLSSAQLSACFSVASAYLSMSRHEGFGVPLLEAMYRGVPVVAYGAAAVPETMGGAGLTTLTRDPLEVARLLAVVERGTRLREQLLDAQRTRVAALRQDAVAAQLKETLGPFLEGRLAPRAPGGAALRLALVSPELGARPDSDQARLARCVAEKLGEGTRVLTLRAGAPTPRQAPEKVQDGGLEVWRFTPDEPLARDGTAHLPGSSALEMAARSTQVPLVLLGLGGTSARELFSRATDRVWGVCEPTLPHAMQAEARRRLGARLLESSPSSSTEQLATRLAELLPRPPSAHAR